MILYAGVSKGTQWYAPLILGLTTLAERRKEAKRLRFNNIKSFFSIIVSIFGIGKLSNIKARYNHSFLVYYSSDFDQWFAINISKYGVMPIPIKQLFKVCKNYQLFSTTLPLPEGVMKNLNHFGKGYDWLGIVGASLSIFKYTFFGGVPHNLFHSKNRDFCSEYVALVINDSGGNCGEPSSVYPESLASYMEHSKLFSKVSI